MLIEWYKVLFTDMAANVNNYISAANAAVSKNVQIRKALADSKVRYDDISKATVNQAARNRANAAENNARIARSTMDANTRVKGQEIAAETEKDIRGIYKNARMTGRLAGGAALLGVGAMQLNKKEEVDPTLGILTDQMNKYNTRISNIKADIERLDNLGASLKSGKTDFEDSDSTSTSTSTSTGGGSKPISSFQASGKSGKYSVADMTKIAEGAGFTPEQAKIMGAIGFAESGGNAGIDTVQSGLDPDKSNEYSVGLFQVNTQAHGDKLAKLGYTEDDLRDPTRAGKVAKMVYDEVGSFKPCSVFKSGAYSKYLN